MKSIIDKFFDRVEMIPFHECWEWTGSKHRLGYGFFYKEGRNRPAHRVSYEIVNGQIHNGLVLDHLCRNPSCVNPDHLEPVTQRENVMRGEGVAAKKARQTHCKSGHEFNEKNTRFRSDGTGRLCRKCHAIKSNQRYYSKLRRPGAIRNKNKTHCIRGHEFTSDNLVPNKKNKRECKKCRKYWGNKPRSNQGEVLPHTKKV